MNKIWLIALISIALGITSCSKDDDKTVYTVMFETDGGTPVPSVQKVEEGSTATAPSTDPVKTGYAFVFWHVSGATTAYNFQTPVKSNITLHAKWQEEATAEYWQVTWDLNGGTWPSGDNHATKVLKGGTLAEPAEPIKSGSTFEGWYKESALTNKVAFPYDVSSITNNITLYAKWGTGGQTSDISLDKTSLELHTTDRERLTATTSATVTWSTSNKDVAIVDDKGIVTATGEGTANITASVGNKSGICKVVVKPSIIVGGYEGSGTSYRLLWKNGEKLEVKDYQSPDIIKSVTIYEGNIYIAGTITEAGGSRSASISKIETAVPGDPLGMRVTSTVMEIKGKASLGEQMFISDGDVYLAGYDKGYGEEYRAAVWKNGKIQLLTDNVSGENYAYSVFVAGNDVYVAGQLNQKPALWKNGIIQELKLPAESLNQGDAQAVAVLGSDVYVVGHTKYRNPILPTVPTWKSTLWKNGTPTVLDENGALYSIFTNGNDIYTGGEKLWKNGVIQEMDISSIINSVYVYDNDVYITSRNGVWINGVKQTWGNNATSVFVK